MGQKSYGYKTAKGVAGGIYDLTRHEVNSRRCEENDGVLSFGLGVVTGTIAGAQVKLPTASSDAFEGVAINGFTTENDMHGDVTVKKDATVGVLHKGRVWVQATDATYGAAAYVVASGANVGKFTATSASNIDSNAKFITGVENGLAVVEF